MAMTEHEGLQIYKDASGNSFILYPITKAHLVDGFEEAVMALAGVADGLAKFAHDHAAGDIKTGVLPIERGGTGGNTAAAALEALGVPTAISAAITASGAARVQVGSYVGTGKYGGSNKNSLTFEFEPKIVHIACQTPNNNTNASRPHTWFWVKGSGFMYTDDSYQTSGDVGRTYCTVAQSGNTISWYNSVGASYGPTNCQANVSGKTYNYIAVG